MFNSIGWGEILFLALFGLIIFGPDKLPNLARDAARALKQVREMSQGARNQIRSELGPEFADLDIDSLNPRTFVRKHLLDELGDDPFKDDEPKKAAATVPATPPGKKPLGAGEIAPFDSDAT